MDTRRHDLLRVLGDGGSFAQVDAVLAWLDSQEGVRPSDIMGLAEVAAHLGVTKQRVWNWTADPTKDFPAPIVELGCGRIFSRQQVEEWKHYRLGGTS